MSRKSWESTVELMIDLCFLAASGSFLLVVCGYCSLVTGPGISESCEQLNVAPLFPSGRHASLWPTKPVFDPGRKVGHLLLLC